MKLNVESNNPNVFKEGTPFNIPEEIYNFVSGALVNVHNNIPAVIVIDGGQGSGKTTLAVELTDVANFLTGKPQVDLEEKENLQYGLGAEQFLSKLPKGAMAGFKASIYDEGGDYSRKGALSRFNKALDQAMATVRTFGSIIFIIVHDVARLPSEMFTKQIVTCLIHCKQRNPNSSYSTAEVYSYVNLCYVLDNKKHVVVPEWAYKGCDFHFRFKDLSPERSTLLKQLGHLKKKELWADTNLKSKGYMTFRDLGNSLGRKEQAVRALIKKLGLKPEEVHKKKNYYSPAVLETLRKHTRIMNKDVGMPRRPPRPNELIRQMRKDQGRQLPSKVSEVEGLRLK